MEIRSVPPSSLPTASLQPAPDSTYLLPSDVAFAEYYNKGVDWPADNEFPKTVPQLDIQSENVTCGRLAFESAGKTETADVLAGSEVGFRVSWDGNGKYGVFWHQGPGQIYLSRAPNDNLASYKGDGDWFKIAYSTPISNSEWPLWGAHDVISFLFLSNHPSLQNAIPVPLHRFTNFFHQLRGRL